MTVVTGPTKDSQSFSTKLSGLPESKEGVYCTGLDPGVRTYSSEVLAVDLTVSTDKSPDAGSTASGYIGLKAEKALSLSSKMTLKKGCSKSKEQQRCVADRYGFELCGNSP